jgi:hypothetical protein
MSFKWSSPITAYANLPAPATKEFPNGTTMELEVLFLALDNKQDMAKLLSLELTMAWINEAREVPKSIMDGVTSRLSRYPPKMDGAPITYTGLIMDTNPPDDDHWWYDLAEVTKPKGYKFFRQPGALIQYVDREGVIQYKPNPMAENVQNLQLGFQYWLNMIPGKTTDWIKGYNVWDAYFPSV